MNRTDFQLHLEWLIFPIVLGILLLNGIWSGSL